MQKAPTVVTLKAKSVAAPASAALPPRPRILTPASVGAARPETTTPLLPDAERPRRMAPEGGCSWGRTVPTPSKRTRIERILRIRSPHQTDRQLRDPRRHPRVSRGQDAV